MARIRTIKPEFFRHEGLQDLEAANPGKYPMMVFAGLWGHCDKAGRFEWKPRTLKLDILPFLPFDMAETLNILEQAKFLRQYEVDGKIYGVIDSFVDHQRLGGKEAQDPEKHPKPVQLDMLGSDGEASGKQLGSLEGKGREGKGDISESSEVILAAWNSMASNYGLSGVQKLTVARQKLISARLKENSVEEVCAAIQRVPRSDFLLGKKSTGIHANWRADIDFILHEQHFAKLIEGGYDNLHSGQMGI